MSDALSVSDARARLIERLTSHVSPLEARLRTRAIEALADRASAELGQGAAGTTALIAALARVAATAVGDVDRLRDAIAGVRTAYQTAASEKERREILTAIVTSRATSRVAAARDVAAMKRWLDIEAIEERFAIEIADRLDDAEVAYHAMAGLAKELTQDNATRRSLRDARVIALAFSHATETRPVCVRVAALRAIAALVAVLPKEERLRRVGALRARQAVSWGRGMEAPITRVVARRSRSAAAGTAKSGPAGAGSADVGPRAGAAPRWVQVAALDVCARIFPDDVSALIAERLKSRSDKDGMIIRRNALRLIGELARAPPRPASPGRASPSSGARATAPRRDHDPKDTGDPEEAGLDVALLARDDPSEHVRQELARILGRWPGRRATRALAALAHEDAAPRVRGAALRELARRAARAEGSRSTQAERSEKGSKTARAKGRRGSIPHGIDEVVLKSLEARVTHALRKPEDPLVVRVAIEAIETLCYGPAPLVAPRTFLGALAHLAAAPAAAPELCDQAAATLRRLQVETTPALRKLRDTLARGIDGLGEAEHTRIVLPAGTRSRDVERALAVAARGDMTVSIHRLAPGQFVLTRGEPRRLRLWRVLHELRTPMPDKRKGFVHTRARVWTGEVVVPPIGMAEVTPTRVPGERHLTPAVGGWGHFLPRVDDLLAVTTITPRPLRIVTSFGTVTVRGPPSLAGRLRARAWISLRYERLAQTRQRSLASAEPREQREYAEAAAALGFSMVMGDTKGDVGGDPFTIRAPLPAKFLLRPQDPARGPGGSPTSGRRRRAAGAGVAAGALLLLLPIALPSWLERTIAYVLSPLGNAPAQLAWLVWLVFAGLVIRSAWIMRTIERARRAIPLTIGGWGTRGKSGCERLKAALFHALRYDVVVKTTGCEAMFIHAMRDLPAQEIFLYRPYDKASIWEQRDVLVVARELRAQVFLWECMALQPRFVDTLAGEWMKDEITTITNAYPDHEDIQGPGGEDVARVIARFMSERGRTFTSEEQMLPLIAAAARKRSTELCCVAPIEADLLPADLLARFPYQEHPRNIALVLALAEHLGVDRELALVEMADYVLMDLGVLKTYPTVRHRGRALTFSNGMSANERAGFLSNWTRLGFGATDFPADQITVGLVNNRGDRVARSRVFAQIFVDDASVDHIVLINSNLGGMMQFIEEALDVRLRSMSITGGLAAGSGSSGGADEGEGPERALARFDEAMRWVKVPSSPGALQEGVARMVRAARGAAGAARMLADPAVAPGTPPADVGAAVSRVLDALRGEMTPSPFDASGPSAAALSGVSSASAASDPAIAEAAAAADRELCADIVKHAERLARRLAARDAARAEVSAALARGDMGAANAAFRRAFRSLFLDRIAVLWDADATGDQVIDFMSRELAPGCDARIMGCQNIKGTGLDFVYRWLSIDRVRAAIERMRAVPSSRADTLAWMLTYSDFGLIDCREALAEMRAVKAVGAPDWSAHANLVGSVIARLTALEREKSRALVTARPRLGTRILRRLEQVVDHLDSVRRTRMASRAMRDLFAIRIGHGRAALVFREIVGRLKGGWLGKDIAAFTARWRRKHPGKSKA